MRSDRLPRRILAAGFIGLQVILGLLAAGGASAGVRPAASGAARPMRLRPSARLLQRVTVRPARTTSRHPRFARVNVTAERVPAQPRRSAKPIRAELLCRP